MVDLKEQLQKKLGIKYVSAKELVAEAKRNCEIPAQAEVPAERYEEVLEEAIELYGDATPAQQAAMKQEVDSSEQPNQREEPAWKKRAVEHAKKRENEWVGQQAALAANEQVRQKLRQQGVDEQEVQNTTVTAVRRVETRPVGQEHALEEKAKPVTRVTTHTVCCVIQ